MFSRLYSKTCFFVLFLLVAQAQEKKNQKEKRRKRISRVATRDQRPTALDSCRLLKKAGENFHYGFAKIFSRTSPSGGVFALHKHRVVAPPQVARDQRPTALDPCRLLKKAGENFQ